MKKFFLLVVVVIALHACSHTPTQDTVVPTTDSFVADTTSVDTASVDTTK